MPNQPNHDVVELILEDHREAKDLLDRVETSSGEEKRDAFRHLVHELARHETAEEEVVYPVIRRSLLDGDAVADARIEEEDEANQLLADLENLDSDSAAFDAKFAELRDAVLAHANAEEIDVLPRLAVMEDQAMLDGMATLLVAAKKTGPTHPHPNIPGTATANLVLGPMAAVVDRTRDFIRSARERVQS
jgi:hemerythrin superfamily protein